MAQANVRICDVKDCNMVGATYHDVVLSEPNGEQGRKVVYYEEVDFCGQHEYNYRISLPKLVLKQSA